MRLIGQLERRIAATESPFQAQLLREDVARLRRLQELARDSADASAFMKAGMRVGWTAGDLRTHEISEPLQRLLESVLELERAGSSPGREQAVEDAWVEMHRARMERLAGCLSTPVPKPND